MATPTARPVVDGRVPCRAASRPPRSQARTSSRAVRASSRIPKTWPLSKGVDTRPPPAAIRAGLPSLAFGRRQALARRTVSVRWAICGSARAAESRTPRRTRANAQLLASLPGSGLRGRAGLPGVPRLSSAGCRGRPPVHSGRARTVRRVDAIRVRARCSLPWQAPPAFEAGCSPKAGSAHSDTVPARGGRQHGFRV